MKCAASGRLFGLLLLAGTLLLTACSNDNASDEKTFHRGNVMEPGTIDPHKMEIISEFNIAYDLFEGLTTYGPDGRHRMGAAERVEFSEDGLTLTFHLREGLLWSDGVPLTAMDFVAGMRRHFDPMTASQSAHWRYIVKGARAVNTGEVPPEQLGVSAPDARTVVVELESPDPYFLDRIAAPWAYPLPRHAFENFGSDWVKSANIVSNGAFKLVQHLPHERIKVVKNNLYRAADDVRLDAIIYYPTTDSNAALNQFRAGELDYSDRVPLDKIDYMREVVPDALRIGPELSVTYITFNTTRKPFDDLRVRRALSIAIDRDVLAKAIMALDQVPAHRFVPYEIENYTSADLAFAGEAMEARRTEAVQLLAEAGFTPENPLEFEVRIRQGTDNRRIGIELLNMWKKIGTEPKMLVTDAATHYNDLFAKNYDVGDSGWIGNVDPESFFLDFRDANPERNSAGYGSDVYRAYLHAAFEESDIAKRNELVAKAEQVFINDMPVTPILFAMRGKLVNPKLKGFEENGVNIHLGRYLDINR